MSIEYHHLTNGSKSTTSKREDTEGILGTFINGEKPSMEWIKEHFY